MVSQGLVLVVVLLIGVIGICWFMWWYVHEKVKEGIPPEARKWG
jgi:hypothetical protein